jgi:hypothetical protein
VASGENTLSNVVRAMLPDVRGTAINQSVSQGQRISYRFRFKTNNIIDVSNVYIAAFLQDTQSKQILQSSILRDVPDLPLVSSSSLGKLGQLKMYPNPAKSWVMLEFENATTHDMELVLSDMLGRRLLSRKIPAGTQKHQFYLDGIENGMHLLQLHGKQGELHSFKLVISR